VDLAAWFQELRRRRVIRALLAWGLFSFAVLQVVEPVQHALGLADWVLKAVVAVLAVGFPVTAGLAWAFDLTRKGIERTAPLDGVDAAVPAPRSGAGPAVALVVVGALVGAVVAWVALSHAGPPAPVAGSDGRILVAVADFANETKDPDLDGLSGLLITSLEQSKRLRVLTRSRMFDLLRQMGRDGVERIDEPLAREVGRKAGARALLLASVRKLDDVYAVEMRALDPVRDEYLFTVRDQVSGKKGLLDLVDRLSERTRRSFRESETEVHGADEKVAETVTSSLEAHRHYFQGLQLLDGYRIGEGEQELKTALAIDPHFALARLALLVGKPRSWNSPRIHQELIQSLQADLDRLPEGDRLVVQAEKAILDGRVDEGLALYTRASAAKPDDKRILVPMAWAELYLRGDPDAAVRLAERASELDPPWEPAHDALAVALVTRGDVDRAVMLALEWADRWPSPLAYSIVQGSLLHAGDPHGAMQAAQRAAGLAGAESPPGWELSRAHIQLGDFEAAERVARRGWTRGHERTSIVLASVLRFRGMRRASERVLDEARRPGASDAWLARIQLAVGDGDPARVLAMAREAGSDLAPGDHAGPLAMAGHPAEAEEWLREEPAIGAYNATIPPRDARRIASAVRARDAGDFGVARKILDDLRAGRNRPVARQAAYVLGETCLLAGDDARLHAQRLVDLWKDADPDLPLLAEARAACRRLGCRPPTAGGAR